MIKSAVYCDFCEKPMPYADPCVITLYKTKEFDTYEKFPHMCESCARKIDDILRDYKIEMGHMYYETLIEEKTHDMTLEEIEKKLGYKVRIITKET